MSDDSSSEDEITKRILQDSIDNDLLTNDMYTSNSKKQKIKNTTDKTVSAVQFKPSLRHIIEDEGHDYNFIKVTPEFQNFVAKHLFKHLESEIVEKKHKKKKTCSAENIQKGIHLFKGSATLIDNVTFQPTLRTHRKKAQQHRDDERLILERASEVAVSTEQVLNREEVKHWAKVTKGKVMQVRPNGEGTFDVISDDF
ncbi:protein CUSTOS-like [Adelges cooleyi]|uniref:protein CUSTOS-like n=1 Tax=Adelges cooleyi TaxID=133065 RepID=UPI00217FD67E|nr:protein CUSTOS-like [Adelges cooleyi]XP_050429458.1 protein CUSTOS-like [Adelges cooleyi]